MWKRNFALAAGGLGLLILLASLLPPSTKHALHTQGTLHPWLHLVAFFTLSFLCARTLPSSQLRLLALLAIVALGWGTELLESLRNGWPIETRDVLLDTLGVVVGGVFGSASAAAHRRANPR